MVFLAVAFATILASAGYIMAGRFAGLSITAFCSATMAFFLMPPIFSLRVAQLHDMIALAVYGVAGLVLAKSVPVRSRYQIAGTQTSDPAVSSQHTRSDLAEAVAEIMLSDLGERLSAGNFSIGTTGSPVPCTREELVQILSDVVTVALNVPDVKRIALHGGYAFRPCRLTLVAYGVWPPPLLEVITIGKRDDQCEATSFSNWPPHSRACWFDNAVGRVYQISIGLEE